MVSTIAGSTAPRPHTVRRSRGHVGEPSVLPRPVARRPDPACHRAGRTPPLSSHLPVRRSDLPAYRRHPHPPPAPTSPHPPALLEKESFVVRRYDEPIEVRETRDATP